MARAKSRAKTTIKDDSGVELFERHALTVMETSSNTANSTYTTQPGSSGDGPIVAQERGKPGKK